jgi:hypothetical protein
LPLVPERVPILAGRRSSPAADDAAAEPEVPVQLMPSAMPYAMPLPQAADPIRPALPWSPSGDEHPAFGAAGMPLRAHVAALPAVQRSAPADPAAMTSEAGVELAFVTAAAPAPGRFAPAVQREVAPGERPSPTAAPGESPAAAAGPSAAAAPAQGEKELDELARKLHDRISAQIRYDLLVERERAGMVTDLR